MTIMIKLGGSLITDKRRAKTFRRAAARGIAGQIKALHAGGMQRLVLGHGSGSFGHFEAQKHNTVNGVASPAQWLGFARVGAVASELSLLLLEELLAADLPALRFQPSSMLSAREGQILAIETRPLALALENNLIPLLHGDVALDSAIGGTIISTEALFARLAAPLDVSEIILLGEVDGVLDQAGAVIPRISPSRLPRLRSLLGAASGVDVTGGMLQKVTEMLDLVATQPSLTVRIANGQRANILPDLILHRQPLGTFICADD